MPVYCVECFALGGVQFMVKRFWVIFQCM